MITLEAPNKNVIIDSFKGLEAVQAGRAEQALMRAALYVQRESQQIVPIDTGALKNSARVKVEGKGLNTVAYIQYLQSYALYVHENLTAKHAPGKTAKFIEIVLVGKRDTINKIIKDTLQA